MFTFSSMAYSDQATERAKFFDFSYAQWVWNNVKTEEQFDKEWERIAEGFGEFQDMLKVDRDKAYEMLYAKTEKGKLMRDGNDLYRIYKIWEQGLLFYRPSRKNPWNDPECGDNNRIYLNIFTGSCSDWPDWRTEQRRAKDEAYINSLQELKVDVPS